MNTAVRARLALASLLLIAPLGTIWGQSVAWHQIRDPHLLAGLFSARPPCDSSHSGWVYIATDQTPGQNTFACIPSMGWTLQSGTGTGNVVGPGSVTAGFLPLWGSLPNTLTTGIAGSATPTPNAVVESNGSGQLASGWFPSAIPSTAAGITGYGILGTGPDLATISGTFVAGSCPVITAAGTLDASGVSGNCVAVSGNGITGNLARWNDNLHTLNSGLPVSSTPTAATVVLSGGGGTIAPGWLPPPTLITLGGVQAQDCQALGQVVSKINTNGTVTCVTPSGGGNVNVIGATTSGTVPVWFNNSGTLVAIGYPVTALGQGQGGTASSLVQTDIAGYIDHSLVTATSMQVANSASPGTLFGFLAKIDGSGLAATAGVTDLSIPVWIASEGAGTTGIVTLATTGTESCTFDAGGATLNHYVTASSTTTGACHDAGSSLPASGWVVGIVAIGTGPGGLGIVRLITGFPAGGSGTGTVNGPGSSTAGFVPTWNNTSGTLLATGLKTGSDATAGLGAIPLTGSNGILDSTFLPLSLVIANAGTTGTSLLKLAKIDTSGHALIAGTGDTAVPVWIVVQGAGTTGSAVIQSAGRADCLFDAGGATAGHFVTASTTTSGTCHDAGATYPFGVFVIGQATGTVGANTDTLVAIQSGAPNLPGLSLGYDGAGTGTKVATLAGAFVNGNCVAIGPNGNFVDNGSVCGSGGGGGTVTSVAGAATGIFAFTGSPVLTTGTLTLTQAGTSGGVPYFSNASTLASSAAMGAGQFMLGGGAGASPTTSFSVVPVANGGSGTASTLVGLLRGGSPFTAAELSGDSQTSGSNVVTNIKVNGVAFPASPGLHSVPVVTATNTATWKVINDCTGAGKALTYAQSGDTFGCNSSVATGNVSGPGSSTDLFVPQWNGTAGTLLRAGLAVSSTTTVSAILQLNGSGVIGDSVFPLHLPLTVFSNETITGTSANRLFKLNTSAQAIIAGTGDTAIPVFLPLSGTGTAGFVTQAMSGVAPCTFDAGGAISLHFITISTTVGGACHDSGATPPASGWVIGTVLGNVASSGLGSILLSPGYYSSGNVSGPGAITSGFVPTWTATNTLGTGLAASATPAANTLVESNGSGVLSAGWFPASIPSTAAGITGKTLTGNGGAIVTSTGTLVAGHCAVWDANGNAIDGPCGAGGGVTAVSGDGALITNATSSGSVTLTLGTAAAHTFWSNTTGSTATPSYHIITAGDLPAIPTSLLGNPMIINGGIGTSSAGRVQLTADFNTSGPAQNGAAGLLVNMTYPSSRGTNDYAGIQINTADTLANGSAALAVLNTGAGASIYVASQGASSGLGLPDAFAADINYSNAGISAIPTTPCVLGAGCQQNGNFLGKGVIIYDWTYGVVISAATNANPVHITATAHGLPAGTSSIVITGGTGNWTAVNGLKVATFIDANTFSIPVDSSAFGSLTGSLRFTRGPFGLEITNVSGGQHPVGRFSNFGDGPAQVTFYAGSSLSQEQGLVFQNLAGTPILSEGKNSSNAWAVRDLVNSRTVAQVTPGASSVFATPLGLNVGTLAGSGAAPVCTDASGNLSRTGCSGNASFPQVNATDVACGLSTSNTGDQNKTALLACIAAFVTSPPQGVQIVFPAGVFPLCATNIATDNVWLTGSGSASIAGAVFNSVGGVTELRYPSSGCTSPPSPSYVLQFGNTSRITRNPGLFNMFVNANATADRTVWLQNAQESRFNGNSLFNNAGDIAVFLQGTTAGDPSCGSGGGKWGINTVSVAQSNIHGTGVQIGDSSSHEGACSFNFGDLHVFWGGWPDSHQIVIGPPTSAGTNAAPLPYGDSDTFVTVAGSTMTSTSGSSLGINSVTCAAGTCTATTASAHSISGHSGVFIYNAGADPRIMGQFWATSTGSTTFTYLVPGCGAGCNFGSGLKVEGVGILITSGYEIAIGSLVAGRSILFNTQTDLDVNHTGQYGNSVLNAGLDEFGGASIFKAGSLYALGTHGDIWGSTFHNQVLISPGSEGWPNSVLKFSGTVPDGFSAIDLSTAAVTSSGYTALHIFNNSDILSTAAGGGDVHLIGLDGSNNVIVGQGTSPQGSVAIRAPSTKNISFTSGGALAGYWDTDQSLHTQSVINVQNGTNVVFRCATAGALPAGALTITSGSCGSTTDTGIRVP